MTNRKPISKKMRFEVLKRDSFTCQYCGKMPPDTTLHIDHIKPVSKGGKNTMLNLVTSCVDCNLGKSDVELSDDSAVKKQQAQLAELAERKSQIEMMVSWRESLLEADELLVDSAEKLVNKYLEENEKSVSEYGKSKLRKAIKKNGYQKVIDAIEDAYCSGGDFPNIWAKRIAYANSDKPKNSIHYVKGILKNRLSYFNERKFYSETSSIEMSDDNYKFLVDSAKSCSSQTDFFDRIKGI